MRISDWSSDVCSSDLLADAGEGRGVAARVAGEIVVEIGVRVEVEDRHRAVASRRGLDEREGHRMVAAEGERNVSILAHIGDVPADHRVVLRRVFGQRRSAEHTSELQSLMRISYAVFCLEKKTNRQD